MADAKTPSFEENLAALEQLVNQLESGQLSLDDSMAAFEKGIKLTHQCQQALATAEQKVQVLIEKNGEASLQPLDPQAGE